MKRNIYRFVKTSVCVLLLLSLSQCKKSGVTENPAASGLAATNISGKSFAAPGAGGGVLMQAFFWNTPNTSSWWLNVNSRMLRVFLLYGCHLLQRDKAAAQVWDTTRMTISISVPITRKVL
jgi:hypothetical protein